MKIIQSLTFVVLTGFSIGFLQLAAATTLNPPDPITESRGPLKISADETVSNDRGEIIEAQGNVFISYTLASRDRIDSHSQYAKYYEKEKSGELTGSPHAIWNRLTPTPSTIDLTAKKINFKFAEEELSAQGNVQVIQTSSTLTADSILYSNRDKKLIARGSRPEFNVLEPQHKTTISADAIDAWIEKKEIHFDGHVSGTVELHPNSQ